MLLRSRVVLPVSAPPIEDGAVLVSQNKIVALGSWNDLRPHHAGPVLDVGERVLLPGLINAHCHLDYTDMAGLIPQPRTFSDWVKTILSFKATWSYSDYAQSWLHGARMLLQHGTTSVADIEAVPELLPEVSSATPLRLFSFLEMTGVKNRQPAAELVVGVQEKIDSLSAGRGGFGLSPHALYSTQPELLLQVAALAKRRNWTLTTHVAESVEEFDMFLYRRGPLFEWLKHQRDMGDCGHGSPVQQLDKLGLLSENFLAVHVNYLWEGDAALLGRRQASVVHCPRSHAYFEHARFPYRELVEAGVNVCLGTDSLASVLRPRGTSIDEINLNLFEEMQVMASQNAALSPESLLRMATLHGARALGRAGELGQLSPGAAADIITLPFTGEIGQVHEAILQHQGPVSGVMIQGEWVWPFQE